MFVCTSNETDYGCWIDCDHCGDCFEMTESPTEVVGFWERNICPTCQTPGLWGLTEDAQLTGDYLLSVADDEWSCGVRGALKDLFTYYRYES